MELTHFITHNASPMHQLQNPTRKRKTKTYHDHLQRHTTVAHATTAQAFILCHSETPAHSATETNAKLLRRLSFEHLGELDIEHRYCVKPITQTRAHPDAPRDTHRSRGFENAARTGDVAACTAWEPV
jgi:hypothetical protein